jgi:YbbR domain-containing protein
VEGVRQALALVLYAARASWSALAQHSGLAALSVALSLSLWVYVTDRENPKETQTFNSAIPIKFVNVPTGLAVANASESSVRIRVEATKSDLGRLRADDFDASVNLGGLSTGQSTIGVDVQPPNNSITIVDVTPPTIAVTLEPVRTKEVPVRAALVGSPQQGFASVGSTVAPETAVVSGPESLVALVDHVDAVVNLTGLKVDVNEDRVELQPRDLRGGDINRVTVNPTTASVTVDIEQREFSAEFVVNPAVSGQPATGYNIASITVDPRIVTLTGALDALQSVDAVRGVSTEEISVADARADVVRQVQLSLPPGVRAQGTTTVRVTIAVRAARGEATFLVAPQVRNVGQGLVLVQPASVLVTLEGDAPTLQTVTPESITVIADASGLGPGVYPLPLQVVPPPGTTVVRTDPRELGVALAERQ